MEDEYLVGSSFDFDFSEMSDITPLSGNSALSHFQNHQSQLLDNEEGISDDADEMFTMDI